MFKLTALFSLLVFWVQGALAQPFAGEKSVEELEYSMEANLNWNLHNALSVYYPDTRFVIKANVELGKVVRKRELPKLPDALLSKEILNLPGLPYVPKPAEFNRNENSGDSDLRHYLDKNKYAIQKISVNVLLDQSLSQNDRSFVRRFVSLLANLEPGRGDQLRIETLDFPNKSEFMPDESAQAENQENGNPALENLPGENSEMDWRPYVFAGGLTIFLLLLFLFGLNKITKHLSPNALTDGRDRVEAADSNGRWNPESEIALAEKDETAALTDYKSSTIDAIVGSPAAAAKVLNQWIEYSAEQGIKNAAMVLAAVSKPLIDLLAPYLGQEVTSKIEQQTYQISEAEQKENSLRLLKQFDQDLRQLALKANKEAGEADALAFLNQMTDDQLQHLVKPLKTGVMGIVLAQLRPNRAAKLIERMDAEQKKNVLAAMANVERIPLDVYKHITRQLAGRASQLKKMRYVRANGIDSLVKVMDYLDDETQDSTLEYLQTQDVALAEKLSKKFMTFNQLFEMPNDKLREVVLDVDRELLAKSLVSVDEQTTEKIINALPEKLGEMVQASLEANLDLSEGNVTEARRSLMRTIRSKQTGKA